MRQRTSWPVESQRHRCTGEGHSFEICAKKKNDEKNVLGDVRRSGAVYEQTQTHAFKRLFERHQEEPLDYSGNTHKSLQVKLSPREASFYEDCLYITKPIYMF